ncbi:MAG TPA: hypothetical protein GXZ43_03040 [Clostridiaceae bacterium]|nr:hypothetical protein [Clostridiaceae bacterium]
MKSLFTEDYSLYDYNQELLQATSDDKVNEIQLVCAFDNSKISVILAPSSNQKDYYGIHPSFNIEKLAVFLRKRRLLTADDFWQSVIEFQHEEKLCNLSGIEFDEDEETPYSFPFLNEIETYEIALLGQAILQTASRFGFVFQLSDTLFNDFKKDLLAIWSRYEKCEQDRQSLFFEFDEERQTFSGYGLWPGKILLELDASYGWYFDAKSEKLVIRREKSKEKGDHKFSDLPYFFEQDTGMNMLKYFTLKEEKRKKKEKRKKEEKKKTVYYSGVMPRVLKMEFIPEQPAANVKSLVVEVGRTTFATVDTFDNPAMISHPFFTEEWKYRIENFYQYEDHVQKQYLHKRTKKEPNQRKQEEEEIKRINKYLRYSINTHTIAISANITTDDKFLLISERAAQSIDGDEYYCSANGQSEFRDKNVDFYAKSVLEDLPTMDFDSNYRIDLNGEMNRETVAELGISQFQNEWTYYGFSYLNINNDKKTFGQIVKRRMHFNLLMHNDAVRSFREINDHIDDATESFENQKIEAIKVNIYHNYWHAVKNILGSFIQWCYDNSTIVTWFLISLSIFFNLNDFDSDLGDIIEISIAIALVILTLVKKKGEHNFSKKKHSVTLFSKKIIQRKKSNDYLDYLYRDNKKIKKYSSKMNAILKVMFSLYLLDKMRQEEK